MSITAALIMLLQANTADVTNDLPAVAGRWVLRNSIERGTGFGGVSATLLSNDSNYRLIVRCDFAYERNISIQFMRANPLVDVPASPVRLRREDNREAIPLDWERVAAGVFARDSVDRKSATEAAGVLQNYVGTLRVDARDTPGRWIEATFDGLSGHNAIARAIEACAAAGPE